MAEHHSFHVNRRSLLVGGGAGVGLLLGWALWPRSYGPNLNADPGESIFNAFLKIGKEGRVVVVVPQAEMGQGVYTTLPQILADELGADWRTVSVEPAPINPLYANDFILAEGKDALPGWLQGPGEWALRQIAIRQAVIITGGSTSIRAFEQRYREAGATARALLCMAAGKRWDADWRACDTADGFVIRGEDKLRFGELAADAADFSPPSDIELRKPGAGGISGKPVPRLDLPSKVDGSALFAADVRLPGLVYASVRAGPFGDTSLIKVDKAAADRVDGVIAVVEGARWVAAVATNWWAADRALDALSPRFRTVGGFPDDVSITAALDHALASGDSKRFFERGDPDEALKGTPFSAEYRVPMVPHAPMETLTATARLSGDRLEVWMPTQAITFARAAVARAAQMSEDTVTVYPTLIGGGFGRKAATDAAEVAAILAIKTKRPVQLTWSRAEETMHDQFRPPAVARMQARLGENGRPSAWATAIAAPSTTAEQFSRLMSDLPLNPADPGKPEAAAIEGAIPPYAIPALSVDHHVAAIGVPTGAWRSVANSYTAFFTECFIDELAEEAGLEPFSYRMQLLGGSPRLARCLTTAATIGDWQGGIAGSGQGIAAHSCFGSHVAMLAELHVNEGKIVIDRIVAAVDCGRIIHPDIVRQQIEGGIIWGIAGAMGSAISIERGLVTARNFSGLGLPILADTPEIFVELIQNGEAPGGVGEIAVPPVAPALANALYAATGERARTLPLRPS